jgi:hypothetical protein
MSRFTIASSGFPEETTEQKLRRKMALDAATRRESQAQSFGLDLSPGRQEAMQRYASTATPSTATPSSAYGTALERPPELTANLNRNRVAEVAARSAPAESPTQGGRSVDQVRAAATQRMLREQNRSEQEGFRYLSPEERPFAVERMGQIRAAHTGISAQMRPPDPVQTPDEVEMSRMRLNSQLQAQLEQQKRETDSQAIQIAGQPVGNDPARIRELNMIADRQGQVDQSLAAAKAGTTFGPTPTERQLSDEANARTTTRNSQIAYGQEVMGNPNDPDGNTIAARNAMTRRRIEAMREQPALATEAQNSDLRAITMGQGPQDVENQIRRMEAETRLAAASAQRSEVDRTSASQDSRYDVGRAGEAFRGSMERISGAVFTDGILYGGRGNVDGSPWFRNVDRDHRDVAFLDSTVVTPLEQYAQKDPVRAAQDAQAMLAQMPPTRDDGTYGVTGWWLRSPAATALTERLNSIRKRLEKLAMGVAVSSPPPAPSGT